MPFPSSFSFLGNLRSSAGGLDRWLCPTRFRLNTCVHTCKLFSKDEGAARKLSGSCSSGFVESSSWP